MSLACPVNLAGAQLSALRHADTRSNDCCCMLWPHNTRWCRIGAYLLLSVVTCIALDWVSGPSQVTHGLVVCSCCAQAWLSSLLRMRRRAPPFKYTQLQVMRLPDPAQLTKVRAAAQRRRTTAQLQLVTAAEKAAKQHKASIGGASGGWHCCWLGELTCLEYQLCAAHSKLLGRGLTPNNN